MHIVLRGLLAAVNEKLLITYKFLFFVSSRAQLLRLITGMRGHIVITL